MGQTNLYRMRVRGNKGGVVPQVHVFEATSDNAARLTAEKRARSLHANPRIGMNYNEWSVSTYLGYGKDGTTVGGGRFDA